MLLWSSYGVFYTIKWSLYGVWKFSYKLLAPQCGVFMESLPDTRYHYQIVEFFFLTLTPFNGILLEFC